MLAECYSSCLFWLQGIQGISIQTSMSEQCCPARKDRGECLVTRNVCQTWNFCLINLSSFVLTGWKPCFGNSAILVNHCVWSIPVRNRIHTTAHTYTSRGSSVSSHPNVQTQDFNSLILNFKTFLQGLEWAAIHPSYRLLRLNFIKNWIITCLNIIMCKKIYLECFSVSRTRSLSRSPEIFISVCPPQFIAHYMKGPWLHPPLLSRLLCVFF